MWWQILPPMGIIGGFVGVMYTSQGIITYLFTGKPSTRNVSEATDFEGVQKLAYKRDTFMCGNDYENRGLDYIEDE